HKSLAEVIGEAGSRLKLFPVWLYARNIADTEFVFIDLIVRSLASCARKLADVVQAKAEVQCQLAGYMPVILDKNVRLPRPVVLIVKRELTGDGGGNTLEKTRQARWWR